MIARFISQVNDHQGEGGSSIDAWFSFCQKDLLRGFFRGPSWTIFKPPVLRDLSRGEIRTGLNHDFKDYGISWHGTERPILGQ